MSSVAPGRGPSGARGSRSPPNAAIEALIILCGISAMILVVGIFFFVFREAFPVLTSATSASPSSSSASSGIRRRVTDVRYGVLALIVGTLSRDARWRWRSRCRSASARAVFVSEFCGRRWRETLKIVIELLAAIPSVVWGFIGFMVMNPLIIACSTRPSASTSSTAASSWR